MDVINYTLKSITYLYSHGHDINTVEFRVPEIKALMRFTYRSVVKVSNMKDMLAREGRIFGKVSGYQGGISSPIRLRLISANKKGTSIKNLLFHNKETNKVVSYMNEGSTFNLALIVLRGETLLDNYRKWFELSLTLFGIGGRARRGRGCFSFESKYLSFNTKSEFLKDLLKLLNELGDQSYIIENDIIKRVGDSMVLEYPFIQQIMLGKKYTNQEQLLKTIDLQSHNYCSEFTGYVKEVKLKGYKKTLRYASPIYVSAIELKDGIHPIIIRLKEKANLEGIDVSQDFINSILGEGRL